MLEVTSHRINGATHRAFGQTVNGGIERMTYNIVSDVPEPGSLALVGLALAGLAWPRRASKRA